MTNAAQTSGIERLVNEMLAGDPQYFLVDVRIGAGNHVKVFLDGDQGITIEKCAAANRHLYRRIVEEGLFPPDDFSLELSSPGLDEPLRMERQYRKNIGRKVEVTLRDGVRTDGVLLEIGPDGIVVEETRGKGKKQETLRHVFPLDSVKTTRVRAAF